MFAVYFPMCTHSYPYMSIDREYTMPGRNKAGGTGTEEFRKMNPAATVPVINDNGVILFECTAILGTNGTTYWLFQQARCDFCLTVPFARYPC